MSALGLAGPMRRLKRKSAPSWTANNRCSPSARPEGEGYDDVAARLSDWIAETGNERGDRLVLMHGMSSRVLRGLLLGLPVDPRFGAPIAPSLPQGTLVMIGNGEEKIIHAGGGVEHA